MNATKNATKNATMARLGRLVWDEAAAGDGLPMSRAMAILREGGLGPYESAEALRDAEIEGQLFRLWRAHGTDEAARDGWHYFATGGRP